MRSFRRLILWGCLAIVFCAPLGGEAARQAKLTVQSNPPGAALFLDGNRVDGLTPITVNVAPGQHQLWLVKPGYLKVARKIEIYSDTGFASFHLVPDKSGNNKEKSYRNKAEPSPSPPVINDGPRFKKRNPDPGPAENFGRLGSGPVTVSYRDVERESHFDEAAPALNVLALEDNPFEELIQDKDETQKPESPEKEAPVQIAKAEPPKPSNFPLVKWKKASDRAEKPAKDEQAIDLEMELPDLDMYDAPIGPGLDPPKTAPKKEEPAAQKPLLEDKAEVREEVAEAVEDAGLSEAAPESILFPPVKWPSSVEEKMFMAVAELPEFPEKFNVLLLGLDRRDARGMLATGTPYPLDKLRKRRARSDVIMVFQIDFTEDKVKVVSIPRDTKSRIPGRRGAWKMNAAYAFGREKLAKRVVENFLGIEIHRTVVADWYSAKKSITLFKSLGLDYNGYTEKELFWHLRKRSFRRGDFRRIERQQKFLQYALGEYLRMANETRESTGAGALVKKNLLDMAIRQGLQFVETDMTYEEAKVLTYALRDYDVREMVMGQVKGRGVNEGGDGEDSVGVYFFKPYSRHSFDDIIARVEAERAR